MSQVQQVSVKGCFTEGWEMFKKHWGILLLASIITTIFFTILAELPSSLDLIIIFFASHIILGEFYLEIKAGRDNDPKFKDLLKGFQRYWHVLIYSFIISIVFIIFVLPFFLFVEISSVPQLDPYQSPLISFFKDRDNLLLILSIVAFCFATIQYFLSIYLVVDDPKRKIGDLFKESKKLTNGNILNLIKLVIISLIISLVKASIFYLLPLSIVYNVSSYENFIDSTTTLIVSILYFIINHLFGVYFSLVYVRFYEKLKAIHYPKDQIEVGTT